MRRLRNSSLFAAVGASALLIVTAVVFSNVTAASRVADNARALHWSNATMGSAALARAAAGQAATFHELAESEMVTLEAVELADAELASTVASLAHLRREAPVGLGADLAELIAAVSAQPADLDRLEAAYDHLRLNLGSEVESLEEDIARSETMAGRVSGLVRLAVTLVLPAAAVLVYRRRAARQVEEHRIRVDVELEAERAVSRAKDQFVAGMSHEIRTPLTSIYGFAQVLLDSPPDTAVDRELVALINTESADLGRMVDDFIAASRIDGQTLDTERSRVDLTAIVDSVADGYRRRGVEVSIADEGVEAKGDAGRIRQILVNLVSNAVRHGGPTIRIVTHSGGDTIRVAVEDDGEGVPADRRDRLFTRFVHTGADPLLEGSVGLGTWVAATFAQEMGGKLDYRRRQGWTEFTLTLPAAAPRPSDPAALAPALGAAS